MELIVKYLKMSAFVILFIGVYILISSFVGIVYELLYVLGQMLFNSGGIDFNSFKASTYSNSVYFTIITAIILIPIFWFIAWLRKQKLLEYCSFNKIRKQGLIISIFIGISLVLPVDFIVNLFSIDKLSPDTEQIFNVMFTSNNVFVLLLGVGIAAPIIEEILFRGLIFSELRKHLPIPVAIVIQGLIFGAMHMNFTQFIYAAPLGILFGVVFIWVKSIWATIFIHISFNSAGVLLSKYFNEQIIFNWYFVILSFIGLIMLMLILWNEKKKSEKHIKTSV
jgi:uncharacterized protein